jgi:hypothetical protein
MVTSLEAKAVQCREQVKAFVRDNTGKTIAVGACAGAVVAGTAAVVVGGTKLGAALLVATGVLVVAQTGFMIGGVAGLMLSAREKFKDQVA